MKGMFILGISIFSPSFAISYFSSSVPTMPNVLSATFTVNYRGDTWDVQVSNMSTPKRKENVLTISGIFFRYL